MEVEPEQPCAAGCAFRVQKFAEYGPQVSRQPAATEKGIAVGSTSCPNSVRCGRPCIAGPPAYSCAAAWTSSKMEARTCSGRQGQACATDTSSAAQSQCPVESSSDKDCPEVPLECSARAAQASPQLSQPEGPFSVASKSLAGSIPAPDFSLNPSALFAAPTTVSRSES